MNNISVTILTKNSEKYIKQVLTSTEPFGEVVIYDNGSTDQTLEIARSFSNVAIHEGPFFGFGPTHNHASSLASNDWILSLDSDEILSPLVLETLKTLPLNEKTVYTFPRHNYYNEKWIKWCGWYPDRQLRLYDRTKTQFSDAQVHEAVMTDGLEIKAIEAPIIHYSYADTSDFLDKMQSYSELFAKQNCGKKSSSFGKAITHGIAAFFKSYFLKRGFMGGKEGFLISFYNANTAFYKYIKLAEKNNEK